MQKLWAKTLSFVCGLTALFGASMAQAAIDVSDVTDQITGDGVTAATAVGAAILTFLGVVLLYKLIRRIF